MCKVARLKNEEKSGSFLQVFKMEVSIMKWPLEFRSILDRYGGDLRIEITFKLQTISH